MATRTLTPKQACALAIKKAGNQAELGRALNISRSAVCQWSVVPPEHVIKVEELTGVSRHLLCPKVFGAVRQEECR